MRNKPDPNPVSSGPGVPRKAVCCPFCEREDTRLLSPFGGQLSVAQYWCNQCRTGFDYLKWEAEPEGW